MMAGGVCCGVALADLLRRRLGFLQQHASGISKV